MTLASLLATAIGLWGMFSGPVYPGTISLSEGPQPTGFLAGTWTGHPTDGVQWVSIQGQGWRLVNKWSTCTITVDPQWRTWPAQVQQNVVTHEYGHCLGQGHTPATDCKPKNCNVMNPSVIQDSPGTITILQRIQSRMSFGEYP